jgi:glycosyltransferase involved in cell wall biosynthesis
MRVALVNTFTPYIRGGAEIVVDDLADQLREHGHEVFNFRIPFPGSYEAPLVATIEATRMMCFDEFERVVVFKFPAYCVQHGSKVIWLFHQFRQVYDLWDVEFANKSGLVGESMRFIYRIVDNENIPLSRHIYTIGCEVSKRLKKYNDIESEVLHPPLRNQNLYYTEKTGNYFFYPSRVTPIKRQHLAIAAMRYVKSGVRLVVTGICEGSYFEQLKSQIREYKLEKIVDLRNEWISDEEKRSLLANSLGVIFVPYKEDYGLISLEAFYSAKPVITCSDSGETGEFITNGRNGYVLPPDPEEIAKAMDHLYNNNSLAQELGKAGYQEIIRRDITWPSTIRKLLS